MVNSLNSRTEPNFYWHQFLLSVAVAIRSIFEKLEGKLKGNSVFKGNTFDNLNMKKKKVERHLRTCAKGNISNFSFLQDEK